MAEQTERIKLLRGTVFITGAASGIGFHTALSFAKYGIDNIVLTDVNTTALATAAKSVTQKYPNVTVLEIKVDVCNVGEVEKAIEQTVAKFGRLDILVNNAGIGGPTTGSHEISHEDWSKLIDINLNGIWRCQKEALKVMLKQDVQREREGRGRIINMASMFGLYSPPKNIPFVAYTAAKHGVVGLTKADGVVYGKDKIRINCICPGWTETPLLTSVKESPMAGTLEAEIKRCSTERSAQVEELSDAIVFLASDLSSFMQGASLVVDGGFTLT